MCLNEKGACAKNLCVESVCMHTYVLCVCHVYVFMCGTCIVCSVCCMCGMFVYCMCVCGLFITTFIKYSCNSFFAVFFPQCTGLDRVALFV